MSKVLGIPTSNYGIQFDTYASTTCETLPPSHLLVDYL